MLSKTHSRISTYGRNGDKQFGIDIRDPAMLAVAQCKRRDTITCADLDKEIKKLCVSHYFIFISSARVGVALQNWADEKNRITARYHANNDSFPVTPSINLPEIHILGWEELRSHLLASTLLIWKWITPPQFGPGYQHLQGLNIKDLDTAVKAIRLKIDVVSPPPCLEASDAIRVLLKSLDKHAIFDIGNQATILKTTINGINDFLQECDKTDEVRKTYQDTIEKIDSRDLITAERGYSQLSELSKHKARILAMPYLGILRKSCRSLLELLIKERHYIWDSGEFEDECGPVYTMEGNSQLRFNFDDPSSIYEPFYTFPVTVRVFSKTIVNQLDLYEPRFEFIINNNQFHPISNFGESIRDWRRG